MIPPTRSRTLLATGAGWCLAFAAAHFYWAAGGRAGVPTSAGPIGDRAGFLAYDLMSGVVFVLAATVGVVLWSGRGAARGRRWLWRATAVGVVLALVRGVGGLLQDLWLVGVDRRWPGIGVAYDGWFAVAGLLFLAAMVAAGGRSATAAVRWPSRPRRG